MTPSHVRAILFAAALFVFTSFTLLRSDVQGEAQVKPSVKVEAVKTEPRSTTAVLLTLAKAVGQTVPAHRLVEYAKLHPSEAKRYWAIVDFGQPSTKKRFYVFDTVANSVETYYVAHGVGSEGAADDGMAETFSNEHGSNSSSLGIYRGLDEYAGKHGRSLRLEGLEPTNSNALERLVVLHTADYVSEDFIRQTGRIGRSDGCFAVEQSVGGDLIDKLKNGAYIIAWKK